MFSALVIEDDATLRLIYRQVLAEMKFEVHEAANGNDALQILEIFTPHLVFVDILLPMVNGEQVLKHIQETEHLQNTYVAVVSAQMQNQKLVEKYRIAEFIQKPIRAQEIRATAKRVIDRWGGADAL
jgi:two-component system, sensor histidine kinase and response regulator